MGNCRVLEDCPGRAIMAKPTTQRADILSFNYPTREQRNTRAYTLHLDTVMYYTIYSHTKSIL